MNSINGYYCNTCGEKYSHTTYECAKYRCKVCWNSHLTRYCEYLDKCQWCNDNHSNKIVINIKIKQIVGVPASYVVILDLLLNNVLQYIRERMELT